MPQSSGGTAGSAGRPDPSSVVATKTLVSPKGTIAADLGVAGPPPAYRVLRTRDVDPYDPPVPDAAILDFGLQALAVGDDFEGTDRAAAKLSISEAAPENFQGVQQLIDSLPDEDSMADHDPPIGRDEDSDRVQEEQRNVRLRAFIYAASRERDNDFHLIVGPDPDSPPVYMTMELSGLPPDDAGSFTRLKAARDTYKEFFENLEDGLPGLSYDYYDPPVPIEVEGSLFFDVTHVSGSRPGPQRLQEFMPVIWEVHPISKITFEP